MCPEKATQSTSSSATSTGWCGASWAASSTIRAPWACAAAASSRTGHSSPVTFDAPVTHTSAGPYGSRCTSARSSASTAAAGVRGASRYVTRAPRHGSSAAWCSVSKTKTSQPAGRARASRLSESVVERVKTTWSPGRQPRNSATVRRLSSSSSVESRDRYPAPRWTLP
ncbi:hypothetical protein BG846_04974 [Streptomyces fradiae ATCC 10745 = DSM 40063]|uniref:Uncharacterized protein n=1 Tax=Streptomyces fradiae ATCC 10745 = DSM 40063 TaxID=1319510 RepID=A0A1Y2NPJ7_STRFR|nr:hypothetical protein BG846_04974 [Streptomyces fradiae ATCC 10745 = DSM 40063]